MMQKTWFRAFIWFISSAFFLTASFCLISALGPGATGQQSMAYMSGMMNAMMNSLMGLSMSIEHDNDIKLLIAQIGSLTLPLMVLGFISGLFIRLRRNGFGR